mmetsp:Transcript_5866/g.12871  ORF Transcript_5866/g.12871 Transcript_5866/m.12871 type:complete len:100 (-) Transcript_5866:8-307(-)
MRMHIFIMPQRVCFNVFCFEEVLEIFCIAGYLLLAANSPRHFTAQEQQQEWPPQALQRITQHLRSNLKIVRSSKRRGGMEWSLNSTSNESMPVLINLEI